MLKNDGQKVFDETVTIGSVDYIDEGGRLCVEALQRAVMIRSQDDLSFLSEYPSGTIAYTAGFVTIWQKSAAGEWVEV